MKKLILIIVVLFTTIACTAQVQVTAKVNSITVFKQKGLQPVAQNGIVRYLKEESGNNTYWIVKYRILHDNRAWAEVLLIRPPFRVGQEYTITLPVEYNSRYRILKH